MQVGVTANRFSNRALHASTRSRKLCHFPCSPRVPHLYFTRHRNTVRLGFINNTTLRSLSLFIYLFIPRGCRQWDHCPQRRKPLALRWIFIIKTVSDDTGKGQRVIGHGANGNFGIDSGSGRITFWPFSNSRLIDDGPPPALYYCCVSHNTPSPVFTSFLFARCCPHEMVSLSLSLSIAFSVQNARKQTKRPRPPFARTTKRHTKARFDIRDKRHFNSFAK